MTQGRIGESLMQHYVDTQMSNGDCCSHPKQERNNLNWYAPTSKVATKEKIIGTRMNADIMPFTKRLGTGQTVVR